MSICVEIDGEITCVNEQIKQLSPLFLMLHEDDTKHSDIFIKENITKLSDTSYTFLLAQSEIYDNVIVLNKEDFLTKMRREEMQSEIDPIEFLDCLGQYTEIDDWSIYMPTRIFIFF